jgi:hypothetical protein
MVRARGQADEFYIEDKGQLGGNGWTCPSYVSLAVLWISFGVVSSIQPQARTVFTLKDIKACRKVNLKRAWSGWTRKFALILAWCILIWLSHPACSSLIRCYQAWQLMILYHQAVSGKHKLRRHEAAWSGHDQARFSFSTYIPRLTSTWVKQSPHDIWLNSTRRPRRQQVQAVKGKLRQTVLVSTWIVLRSLVGLDKDQIPNNFMLWVMLVSSFHMGKNPVY